jgi:hypothetical protein
MAMATTDGTDTAGGLVLQAAIGVMDMVMAEVAMVYITIHGARAPVTVALPLALKLVWVQQTMLVQEIWLKLITADRYQVNHRFSRVQMLLNRHRQIRPLKTLVGNQLRLVDGTTINRAQKPMETVAATQPEEPTGKCKEANLPLQSREVIRNHNIGVIPVMQVFQDKALQVVELNIMALLLPIVIAHPAVEVDIMVVTVVAVVARIIRETVMGAAIVQEALVAVAVTRVEALEAVAAVTPAAVAVADTDKNKFDGYSKNGISKRFRFFSEES